MQIASNNQKASRKKKSNVVYISSYKKRNVVKAYTKTDDDWYDIWRANDNTKKISDTAAKLCSKLEYELHKNNDRPVFLSPYWFKKVTQKERHQNARLRNQIKHIFEFKFHSEIIHEGKSYSNVYEVWHTLESHKILNLEDIVILQNTPSKPNEAKLMSCSGNAPGVEQKSSTYMYDKEKEEEPLGYSSSFSNNEKLKIKSFSEPEETPQEEITEIPTLATGYPTEPAKVYQTEEIHVEASEVVTNCHEFEAQPYGKSVQLESQALTEEKELYQSHRNLRPSSGLNLLQDIPLLANLLTQCDERPTVEKSSTVVPEITKKHEEVTPMKNNPIPLEPERNMEFELSGAIFKSFGGVKSDEIMENCKFIPINENKLGVQLSNGFSLNTTDRDRLKTCIRLVYGEGINIVSSAVLKIAQPKTEILVKPQIQQYYHQWTKFRNDLLNYLPEKTGHHSLNAWFDKFRVSEDPKNNRIILTGSRFYVDSVYNRFQSAIEHVVTKNKVTLELHFENNDEKPIIYKPNGGF